MEVFGIVVGSIASYLILGYSIAKADFKNIRRRYLENHKREWPRLDENKYWKRDKVMVFVWVMLAYPIYYTHLGVTRTIRKVINEIEE